MNNESYEKYLLLILNKLDLVKQKTMSDSSIVNFSCPYCNEGNSKGKKHRAFILKNDGYRFYCHNCGTAKNFDWFLRYIDPELFKQYFAENKKYYIETFLNNKKKNVVEKEIIDDTVYMELPSDFILATSVNETFDYIKARKIPEKFWNDIWFSTKKHEAYSNSIIFPLRKGDKVYGFVSRNIYNKFFHIELADDKNIKLYNYYNVNKMLDCFFTESIIDSLFLENSIAMNGSTISKKYILDFKNPIFVLDNDNTGILKSKKMIEKGYKIFIMPKELIRYKDINELVRAGVPAEKIPMIVNKNIYSGKEALIKLALNYI